MKLKELLNSITKNKYRAALLKGLAGIGLIIIISTVSVHYLTGDTLSEYAKNNPEQAYPTTESIPAKSEQVEPATVEAGAQTPENGITETTPAENNNDSVITETAPVENSNESVISEVSESESTDFSPNDDSEQEAEPDSEVYEAPLSTLNISSINIGSMIHFYAPTQSPEGYLSMESDDSHPGRINYDFGFYIDPLSDEVIDYITGTSYPDDAANPQVSLSELRYVGILYYDFNGCVQAGELICNEYIANDLVEIFCELYKAEYQFEKIVLIDNYGGDDTASMCADNTSCFNYRVVEGKTSLSKHAYGLAIDVNPFYNPYLVYGGNEDGSDYISPSGSEIYIDRSQSFAYKIDENDLLYKLFIAHGFTWGGNWNSCKDYQHFQKTK